MILCRFHEGLRSSFVNAGDDRGESISLIVYERDWGKVYRVKL